MRDSVFGMAPANSTDQASDLENKSLDKANSTKTTAPTAMSSTEKSSGEDRPSKQTSPDGPSPNKTLVFTANGAPKTTPAWKTFEAAQLLE
jgi:hypothetical protein